MAADNQLVLEEEERREMKMIKAKKGLIITLFAAMMVFAFGATSVFATDDTGYTWSSKCATVDDGTTTWQSSRVFSVYGDNDGLIEATPVERYVGEKDVPALNGCMCTSTVSVTLRHDQSAL